MTEPALRLAGVSKRYGVVPAAQDLVLDAAPGELVTLIGPSGCGKSTTLRLVAGLERPDEGCISIAGVVAADRRTWQPPEKRRVGLVSSSAGVYPWLSARETLLFFADLYGLDPIAADGQVDRLSRLFGLNDFLDRRCVTLSTGQKQLLSFARALAHDPEILILDEATSSVDSETEVLIQEALVRLLAGRTSLVVAHRLSTVRHVDRILVLHRGEIREEGTHQELLRRRGLYHTLYQLQYKDQEALAGRE